MRRALWLAAMLLLGACHRGAAPAPDWTVAPVIGRHVRHPEIVPHHPAQPMLTGRERRGVIDRTERLRAEMTRLQSDNARLRAILQRPHKREHKH